MRNSKVEFLSAGLFTSLQDQGRYSHRSLGIPAGGAMDRLAARQANLLLNNKPEAAVLEITQIGPRLLFHAPAICAIAGAEISLKINDSPLGIKSIFSLQKGDVLFLGKIEKGMRSYLAIKDGFEATFNFDSVSKISGLQPNLRFEKGDQLDFVSSAESAQFNAKVKIAEPTNAEIIFCQQGPEFEWLREAQQSTLWQTAFEITSHFSRMAFPLQPTPIGLQHKLRLLTGPVTPGVIQLTPSGQLIVLMRDAQTTGGYPRVLVLPERSINEMAQKRVGAHFKLKLMNRI